MAAKDLPKTRDRILTESLRLFASKGFAGVTVVEIEEAAGLAPGRGGFYRHFTDKEAVLRAAIAEEIDRVRAKHAEQAQRPPSADARVEVTAQLEDSLRYLREVSALMLVLAHDGSQFPDLLADISEAFVEGAIAGDSVTLERFMDAGQIAREDPAALAVILLMANVGFSLSETFFGGAPAGMSSEAFARALARLVVPDPL
jgi:AcrR family transcriptional regulator